MRGIRCISGTPKCGLRRQLAIAISRRWGLKRAVVLDTESVVISDLSTPAADEVDPVLFHPGHLGIPFTHQPYILVDLVRLDLVEDNRMDIFSSRQDFGEGPLDILV